jgi:hypothetical protein
MWQAQYMAQVAMAQQAVATVAAPAVVQPASEQPNEADEVEVRRSYSFEILFKCTKYCDDSLIACCCFFLMPYTTKTKLGFQFNFTCQDSLLPDFTAAYNANDANESRFQSRFEVCTAPIFGSNPITMPFVAQD